MKKRFKGFIFTILLCTVLASCSNSGPSHEIPLEQSSNCPISTMRTGTERQGIKTYGNGFECTDTGSYFMCDINGISWLLYVDHDSDTIVKLCGRPDCNHTGEDCNAYFGSAKSICYYNGFLYTFYDESFTPNSGDIIRINLDGTERVTVYNVSSFEKANNCKGRYNPKVLNGIFMADSLIIDENGQTVSKAYYYKLDGSMKVPKFDSFSEMLMNADGENFLGVVDYDQENDLYVYGIWEPENGVTTELFKAEDIHTRGYIGTKAEYYVENGIIIENSYTEGKKKLIDTGLNGNYQLVCFPDCMVVYEFIPEFSGIALKETTLYFYGWDGSKLGNVRTNYTFNDKLLETGLVCGETPERIILTDSFDYVPRYYINKSDFGTGNIEIHAFNMPDFGEE